MMSSTTNIDNSGQSEPRSLFTKRVDPSILASLLPKQVEFIVSLQSLDPSLEEDQLRETFAEMFFPSTLFNQEILDLRSGLVELRKFMESRGVNLTQQSSRRVIQTVAHELYSDAEDCESAIQTAFSIISHGRRVRMELSATAPQETQTKPQAATSSALLSGRIAHNLEMRLNDSDSKFDGDLEECWGKFVDSYLQIAKDYNLTMDQKLQCLHNVLSKDALQFRLDAVQLYATTFQ